MATTLGPHEATQQHLDVLNEAADKLPADAAATRILHELIRTLRRGEGVALLNQDETLTPNQAAERAGMSRPHLVRFMDSGSLTYHRVGTHRRIYAKDLIDFMKRRDDAAKAVAEAIAAPQQSAEMELDESDMAELDQL